MLVMSGRKGAVRRNVAEIQEAALEREIDVVMASEKRRFPGLRFAYSGVLYVPEGWRAPAKDVFVEAYYGIGQMSFSFRTKYVFDEVAYGLLSDVESASGSRGLEVSWTTEKPPSYDFFDIRDIALVATVSGNPGGVVALSELVKRNSRGVRISGYDLAMVPAEKAA